MGELIPIEINWLKKNKAMLNIAGIENELSMPKTTIHLWLCGSRALPKKWEPALVGWVKKFVSLKEIAS